MPKRMRSIVPGHHVLLDESPPDSAEILECLARIRAALSLSPAQGLVALGIWRGMSEEKVAAWMGRSPATVHSHISAIYRRFDAHGIPRGQAALVREVERAIAGGSAEMGGNRATDGVLRGRLADRSR
jgi:DNA-binding NarL/FixJ family response regulator